MIDIRHTRMLSLIRDHPEIFEGVSRVRLILGDFTRGDAATVLAVAACLYLSNDSDTEEQLMEGYEWFVKTLAKIMAASE